MTKSNKPFAIRRQGEAACEYAILIIGGELAMNKFLFLTVRTQIKYVEDSRTSIFWIS
jgi:hypothetical protein